MKLGKNRGGVCSFTLQTTIQIAHKLNENGAVKARSQKIGIYIGEWEKDKTTHKNTNVNIDRYIRYPCG